MNCPYCSQPVEFKTSKEFYGRDFGSNVYVCEPCNAYVGTHGNSKKPLGTLATYKLRELRKRAHSLFDPLWRSKEMSRGKAYQWLSETMNVPETEAHIGMFDLDQCRHLIRVLEKRYRKVSR